MYKYFFKICFYITFNYYSNMKNFFINDLLLNKSAISLILSNLFVLFVVWFSNLSIFHVLLIFWIETIIIAFSAFFKIVIGKIFFNYKKFSWFSIIIGFSIVGFSLLIYLPFILALSNFPNAPDLEKMFSTEFIIYSFIFSVLVLFISHLISFIVNFSENFNESESKSGKRFWNRILIIHITIILGIVIGFLAFSGNIYQGIIIILILLKIIFDLKAHLKYHSK